MNIQETLLDVMNNYSTWKNLSFQENQPQSIKSKSLKNAFNTEYWSTNYRIKGSVGQFKNWATIPWIGIFDKDITLGASSGFYIVYLFSSDMKRVYLSLNQGWSYYEKNIELNDNPEANVSNVSDYWRENLTTPRLDINISADPISLINNQELVNTRLPKGYELGNIFSIEYKKESYSITRIVKLNERAEFFEIRGNELLSEFDLTPINFEISLKKR
ncbi:DUF3578 domain-containing protein [Weissella diestrammenae]|uniref:DUF3578 domain-containing protein n=1 Tax=Weissella diestrammenae TaxID=1162633 RepID=A0A7G9T4I0_9LACO|nr:DUF3578 domain-containing protein [Weissella diestrammenae]MCM0582139.1 DUF3578 domain-containing protein [Weissella diestrammenae]QNN75005.1 DUF3578 domain-containing protein [Weissella diestrammenae]